MKGRTIAVLVAVAFGLGGLMSTLSWLASGSTKATVMGIGRPIWTDVAWPFAPDEWGRGKAFQCNAANCSAEINLYIRAKIGFCDCETGIADDAALDRMGDVDVFGGQARPVGDGRAITVGHMRGRSRSYVFANPTPVRRTAISAAFNDRCDMTVATIILPHDRPEIMEQDVMEFLNSPTILRWATVTLGL